MLNIKDMNTSVENALASVRASIRAEFGRYFDQLIPNSYLELQKKRLGASLHEITDIHSLEAVLKGPGFYVIFSSCTVKGQPSRLTLPDGRRAIYRGEGRFVQRRVESHLFNAMHKRLYMERKQKDASEQHYGICMKIEKSENGINVDLRPYSLEKWAVLVVSLPKSLSVVRKQAETAFDLRFGTPAASRDVPK